MALDEFLVKNDPCRGTCSQCYVVYLINLHLLLVSNVMKEADLEMSNSKRLLEIFISTKVFVDLQFKFCYF